MTPDKQRELIKERMTSLGVNACRLILESKYTGLRAYLNGGKITTDNLWEVEQALDRMEATKDATTTD
jgi:hypothetical protein